MRREKEKYFVDIYVQELYDEEMSSIKILEQKLQQKIPNSTQKIEINLDSSNYYIHREFASKKLMEDNYLVDIEIYNKTISFIENLFHLIQDQVEQKFKKMQEIKRSEHTYLVLKTITNYKNPIRTHYQFFDWFMEKFGEGFWWEELENGFLLFYQQKIDYKNSLLDKTNFKGFIEWITNKNIKIPEKYLPMIQEFYSSLTDE